MNRMPDNPSSVSLDFLRKLDDDQPGMWMAQRKLDGWRKIADNTTGTWHYGAKHTKGDAAKKLPESLRLMFESLAWPEGIVLDCEWVGNRVVSRIDCHSLHIFDILQHDGVWLGNIPFNARHQLLEHIFTKVMRLANNPRWMFGMNLPVQFVPVRKNPGLVQMYKEQIDDPLSEGLVVRHANSGLVGSFTACAKNPQWFKVKYR